MSDTVSIDELIREAGLEGRVERVNDTMWCMRRGSAMVIVGIAGAAIVVIAPLFAKLPEGREGEFCQLLLQLNASMGGMAAFAIQKDGWVVLHAGRGIKGMDAEEFGIMVGTVGKFADDYDNQLYDAFYADDDSVAEPAEDDEEAEASESAGNGADSTASAGNGKDSDADGAGGADSGADDGPGDEGEPA